MAGACGLCGTWRRSCGDGGAFMTGVSSFGCGDSQNDALKEGNPIGLPARHGNPTEADSTIVFAALAVSLTAAGSNPAGTWC